MNKLFYFLIIIITVVSCKKNTTVIPPVKTELTTPTSSTGTLIGAISPVEAATTVMLTKTADNSVISAKTDNKGQFKIQGLDPGDYLFALADLPLYNKPTTQPERVTVSAGKVTDIGNLEFSDAYSSITGNAVPVGAASEIKLMNNTTKTQLTIAPDNLTGSFAFNKLIPGDYTMSFTANPSSKVPADLTFKLIKNIPIPLGNIVFETPGITGMISGMVSPVSGARSIGIFDVAANSSFWVTPDANTGKYITPKLLPSYYQISFDPQLGYARPQTRAVTLIAGQKLDLGLTKFETYIRRMSYQVSGLPVSSGIGSCQFLANLLILKGLKPASPADASSSSLSMEIRLDNVIGPGTYQIQGTPNSNIIFKTGYNSTYSRTWEGSKDAGSVDITAIDYVNKIIKGTFRAELQPTVNAFGTKNIEGGTFEMSY